MRHSGAGDRLQGDVTRTWWEGMQKLRAGGEDRGLPGLETDPPTRGAPSTSASLTLTKV